MLKESMEIIINAYKSYQGTGMYLALFFISILYLYITEKDDNKKVFFVYYPFLALFIIINPIFYKFAIRKILKNETDQYPERSRRHRPLQSGNRPQRFDFRIRTAPDRPRHRRFSRRGSGGPDQAVPHQYKGYSRTGRLRDGQGCQDHRVACGYGRFRRHERGVLRILLRAVPGPLRLRG